MLVSVPASVESCSGRGVQNRWIWVIRGLIKAAELFLAGVTKESGGDVRLGSSMAAFLFSACCLMNFFDTCNGAGSSSAQQLLLTSVI